MTANYKSYRVRVQMECGHTEIVKVQYPNRVPDEYVQCGRCNCLVAVWAIECREWRSKCQYQSCHFTRWTGQSQSEAKRIASQHLLSRGHHSAIRYSINPQTFEIVKRFAGYAGRRFRFRIEENTESPRVPIPRRIYPVPETPPF